MMGLLPNSWLIAGCRWAILEREVCSVFLFLTEIKFACKTLCVATERLHVASSPL